VGLQHHQSRVFCAPASLRWMLATCVVLPAVLAAATLAALRVVAGGYTNVLWHRGGVEAWKAAGLPLYGGGSDPGAGSPQS
jgi:hypothetical protein